METRYSTSPDQIVSMSTEELRSRYLVQDLFAPGEVRSVYSHQDRVVILGIQPAAAGTPLPTFPELRAQYLLERREAGVVNVGGAGTITVDGTEYLMDHADCLYLGRGSRDVTFTAADPDGAPAQYYVFTAPAHTAYPTTQVKDGQGIVRELGEQTTANRRTLNQYIHPDMVKSCQVGMGVTKLHDGSMWNTMPSHTHDRRMEAYLYFHVADDARVVHLMGQPQESRHLIVADKEAIISPSWSIHSGVGTRAYWFVWAMAGENQSFDDMDTVEIADIR